MNWIDLSGMERPGTLPENWTFFSAKEYLTAKELATYEGPFLFTFYSEDIAENALFAVRDHINVSGINPLRGHNDNDLGVRFPDMSHPYAPVPNFNIKDAIIIRAGRNVAHPVDAIEANELVFQTILAKHQLKTVYAVIYGKKVKADKIIKLFQGE